MLNDVRQRTATQRRPGRLALVVCVLAIGGSLGALDVPTRASTAPDDAGELARRILEDPGYQRELPGDGSGDEQQPSGSADQQERRARDGSGGDFLSQLLLFLLMIVGGAFVIGWLINRRASAQADVEVPPETLLPGVAPSLDDEPLESAGALAAQGHYAEAIHVLLLRTFAALAAGRRLHLPPALTSREVARRLDLPSEHGVALDELVHTVELSLFGEGDASEHDWLDCAARFEQLQALGRAG